MAVVSVQCRRWIVVPLAMWLAAVAGASEPEAVIDPQASWAGFQVKTRWGQTLDGQMPVLEGQVFDAGGGRKRVRLVLSAHEAGIEGNRRYSELMRGEGFFDAARHPTVVFESDAHAATLAREGGKLAGELTIRGTTRREVFSIAPSSCERPGIDCAVVASGVVYRGDFQLGRWGFALSDRVRLQLRLRVAGDGT